MITIVCNWKNFKKWMICETSSRWDSNLNNKNRTTNTIRKWAICNNNNSSSSSNHNKGLTTMSSSIFQVQVTMVRIQGKDTEWTKQWRNNNMEAVTVTLVGIWVIQINYQGNHHPEAHRCRVRLSNRWIQRSRRKMIGEQMTLMIFFQWIDVRGYQYNKIILISI